MDNNKPVASVCHGQQILGAIPGILTGKKATAYPTCKYCVEACGGEWVQPDPIDTAVTSGNLVTAAAWPGHPEFIKQFVALLGAKVTLQSIVNRNAQDRSKIHTLCETKTKTLINKNKVVTQ